MKVREKGFRDYSLKSPSKIMSERGLIVVKWMGIVPLAGMCTCCGRNFDVPADSLRTKSDAMESLGKQFDEHTCEK